MGSRFVLLFALALVTNCVSDPPRPDVTAAAPWPNGCFAFVFDQPTFEGARHVLDGPLRVSPLATITAPAATWDRRIRSICLGDTAKLAVYGPNLNGRSARYTPARPSHESSLA